jgi:hypothetical protein
MISMTKSGMRRSAQARDRGEVSHADRLGASEGPIDQFRQQHGQKSLNDYISRLFNFEQLRELVFY